MHKGRLEAFSDGVLAIIITIMVLELHPPHEATPQALLALAPALLSYILSFIFIGIYWNNHHHTFQVVKHVGGAVLWANLHLLFWLSLIPFVTAWMGESHFARWPVLAYGCVLLACALAYTIMIRALIAVEGRSRWRSTGWHWRSVSCIRCWRPPASWRSRSSGSFPTGGSRRSCPKSPRMAQPDDRRAGQGRTCPVPWTR